MGNHTGCSSHPHQINRYLSHTCLEVSPAFRSDLQMVPQMAPAHQFCPPGSLWAGEGGSYDGIAMCITIVKKWQQSRIG